MIFKEICKRFPTHTFGTNWPSGLLVVDGEVTDILCPFSLDAVEECNNVFLDLVKKYIFKKYAER